MILKFIKSLFQKTIVDEGQEDEGKEHAIHKSLNAAILTDIINQNNLRSETESNNNN